MSTAYYALFLVSQRSILAREFDHAKMTQASNGCNATDADLRRVAGAFVRLQQFRRLADYDAGKTWIRVESVSHIDLAKAAFSSWGRVRDQRAAQDYLLSMLVSRR